MATTTAWMVEWEREGLAPSNKITDAGVCDNYSGSTRMLLPGETNRWRTNHSSRFFLLKLKLQKVKGAGLTHVPVDEVVFVKVQKPWSNVTCHSLEDQRVRCLRISYLTAVEVTLQITLRGEKIWEHETHWLFFNSANKTKQRNLKKYIWRTEQTKLVIKMCLTIGQNSMTNRKGVTSVHCAKHCKRAGCWRVLWDNFRRYDCAKTISVIK